MTQVDQRTLQGLRGDAATEIIKKLTEEGIKSEGGIGERSDGVHETLIPITSRAFEIGAREDNFLGVIGVGSRGRRNVLA